MYNSGYTGGLHEIKKHTTQGTKKKQDWDKTPKHVIDHSRSIINWYNKNDNLY